MLRRFRSSGERTKKLFFSILARSETGKRIKSTEVEWEGSGNGDNEEGKRNPYP
jgi:hypothetical protein